MSLTLGEKLRQAREERGFTLGEVADQTRISALYLESIEHDDYSKLPGGIFNKGFVKSYAKFVGVNEQEALADYTSLMSRSNVPDTPELKLYKPEVLTDDRSSNSMVPTVITAVVILGIMTAGILFLVNYMRQPSEPPPVVSTPKANSNSGEAPGATPATSADTPDMATLKVEFKATTEPVSLSANSDGKLSSNVITPGSTATFEPRESLKLSYSRSLAKLVQLFINGKQIALPSEPLTPKRNVIDFEINKGNLAQIWASGAISNEVPPVATENTNTAAESTPASTPVPGNVAASTPAPSTPRPIAANTAANKPAANANSAPKPTPAAKPASTPAPATPKPAANNE